MVIKEARHQHYQWISVAVTSQLLDDGSYRVSREKVFADSESVPIATMLRSRRLRWIGHLLRGKQDDPAAKCLRELVGGSGKWWGLAAADLRSIDLDISALSRVAIDRRLWRRMTWEWTVPQQARKQKNIYRIPNLNRIRNP